MYGSYSFTSSRVLAQATTGDGQHARQNELIGNVRREGSTLLDSRVADKPMSVSFTIIPFEGDTKTVNEIVAEMKTSVSDIGRYFRVLRDWRSICDVSSLDDWQVDGDTTSISLNSTDFMFDSSIEFNYSENTTYAAGIRNEMLAGVNLSDVTATGNFEFGVYVPASSTVASVSLQVGSDLDNYLSSTFEFQYDGAPIATGWNWFSVGWSEMAVEGAIDTNLLGRYIQILVNYDDSQESETGLLFTGLIWQNEKSTRNYRSVDSGIARLVHHANYVEGVANFVCTTGVAEDSSEGTFYTVTESNDIVHDASVEFGGSYPPIPIMKIKLLATTNLDSIRVENLTTQDLSTITDTWSDGDTLYINFNNGDVKLNNINTPYTAVLPRFVVGLNKIRLTFISDSQDTEQQTTQNTNLTAEI